MTIYSNRNLNCEERTFDFGTIYQIKMGEEGRGRRLMALTVPKGIDIAAGENPGLSMAFTKSGKPRIIRNDKDTDLYMLISTDGGYTRRGNGYACQLGSEGGVFETLATGNGADGDAGRIGSWRCYFVKAPKNGILLVHPSGGCDPYYLLVKDNKVIRIDCENVCEAFDQLDMEIPFTYDREHPARFVGQEWDDLTI